MNDSGKSQGDVIAQLLALGSLLEGIGQYNVAKVCRAAADAVGRRAGFEKNLSSEKAELIAEIEQAISVLSSLGIDETLLDVLHTGAEAISEDRLPLIHETPHPYICRRCGDVRFQEPVESCPTCGAWPLTYKEFLPVYWLTALDPYTALEQLQKTPMEVLASINELSEDALTWQPEDGGWSIRHVVSHLRDAQGVLYFRLNLLLDEEDPKITSQAVFEWATKESDHPPTTNEIFTTYRESRSRTIERLQSIQLKDWWRPGQHEEFGPVTVLQQVSYFATHEITHLPQMKSLREALSSS